MKEIGEELKQLRKKSGVDLEEASHDLNISEIELECIEAGNAKAFKDIYELKEKVRLYAKYLGVKEDRINDEFNDFLFEKTSKISLDDVKKIKEKKKKEKEEVNDDRVSSPYTKIKVNKFEVAPLVFGVIAILFIALVLYIVLKVVKNDSDDSRELMAVEDIYELTK